MQIEIKIDDSCKEPKLILVTNEITDEINHFIQNFNKSKTKTLIGFKGDIFEILDQYNILRIYASNGKVFALTNNGEYVVKMRLYEIEESLDKNNFIRISNSEIINLKKTKNFNLRYNGTICILLVDGTITYASRRYVSKIKQALGI